jgi:hypothetical protein
MRKLALLALLIAPALAAQTADVGITTLDTNRTSYENGERFTITMRWKNFGPDTAQDVVAELGGDGIFVVTGAGTSGWPCEPSPASASFICHGFLHPGAEAQMVVTMRAPARGSAFNLTGSVRTSTYDPVEENNTSRAPLELARPNTSVALSISPRAQTHHAAAGARVTIPVTVSNAGPGTAQNLVTLLSFAPGSLIPIEASGEGWSCQHTTHSPWTVLCMRSSLAAGVSAPITVTTNAPQTDSIYEFSARVSAERAFDENGFNDAATATLVVGTPTTPEPPADVWKRILLPVLPSEVPGQNNARWKTEITMIANGANIAPSIGTAGPAQFLYVRQSEEAKVHINARVFDLSRATETAGSEVPIVRERDFRSTTIALIGIPIAPHYRHTLRIYDLEGRNGARVAIRLYANDETTPRATVVRTLSLFSGAKATPDQLPVYPAYLQLDPATLAPIAGNQTMRIEIEPLDEGLKLWSFVSVTNNETHHVTTFSAQ